MIPKLLNQNLRALSPDEIELVSGGELGVSLYGSSAYMSMYSGNSSGMGSDNVYLSPDGGGGGGGGQSYVNGEGKVVILLDDGPGHYSADGNVYYDSQGNVFENFSSCVVLSADRIMNDRIDYLKEAFPWPVNTALGELLSSLGVTDLDLSTAAANCN